MSDLWSSPSERGTRVSQRSLLAKTFGVRSLDATPFSAARSLFRRLLLALGEREALRLFTACLAFLNVVSALAVSHKF